MMQGEDVKGPGVHAVLGELLSECEDIDLAVEKFLVRPDAEVLVRDVLVWVATQIVRSRTRRVERHVAMRIQEGAAPGEARRELVEHTFALPDGRRVQWLTATAEEHRQRAQWQRVLAGACVADAELHEQAASDIEAAGVSCLADLDKKNRKKTP